MKAEEKNGCIIIKKVSDFLLSQTLECGQCFHFYKLAEEEYVVVAYDKMLHIKQNGEELVFYNTSKEDYNNIWRKYFDLDRDYSSIKSFLIKADKKLVPAINEKYGVRILNQQFSETLMSFIISQTKQIPQIKQVVNTISERYGKCVGEYLGKQYYSFPDINALKAITKEEFLECKAGFRAEYLVEAAKFLENRMNEDFFSEYTYDEAKAKLMSIKGVGEKVANCVLLFSLGYRNAFPVDVWIKRTMEELYFHKETNKTVIQKFGEERFKEYGGYAQQYLFYFGKTAYQEKNSAKAVKEKKDKVRQNS